MSLDEVAPLDDRRVTSTSGAFEIHTVQPTPYQIPTDGSCGNLLTAQLYFPGDEHNDDDIASAVKPELILDSHTQADGTATVAYDFVLDPEKG